MLDIHNHFPALDISLSPPLTLVVLTLRPILPNPQNPEETEEDRCFDSAD